MEYHLLVGDNFTVSQGFWGGWYIVVKLCGWMLSASLRLFPR